jgi:5-formyltetrahydrofolate cyclo-ligase
MSTDGNNDNTTTNNNNNHDDLDAIFKQKRILRTQVRKTLKAIDPSLRSQQGTF